jgi:hypothetical protein
MFAPVATDVAWQVQTDFEHMAEWMPNVQESKVIAREPNAVTIEQHGVAKFGIASFACVSVRHIEPDPPRTIRSTQTSPTIARASCSMCSSWQTQPASAGVGHGSSRGANYCGPQSRRSAEIRRISPQRLTHVAQGCAYIGLTRALAKKDNPDGP